MHTYGHQWACQIFYGPRFRKGMGLTDGEGVERIWSRLRKLIAITRAASVRGICFYSLPCISYIYLPSVRVAYG